MATRKRSTTSSTWSASKIVSCIAWIAVLFIAIAMALSFIPAIKTAFLSIAQALAYVVTATVGFFYANRGSKYRTVKLIAWAIGSLAILVVFVVGFFA